MKVISVPAGLRLALALTVLAVPLAAIEVVITMNAPWWGMPYRQIAYWSGLVGGVFLPLALLTAFGKRWAFFLIGGAALVWIGASTWLALKYSHFWLGVFTLVLALFWLIVWQWIRFETRRSYFDPFMKWYQGSPRPIPGLICEAGDGPSRARYKVSRLDRDGVFVFNRRKSSLNPIEQIKKSRSVAVSLCLKLNGRSIQCDAEPVRLLGANAGAVGIGFRFNSLTADARKELGDFVEALRGKGYVD